jgi:hypothetical protein
MPQNDELPTADELDQINQELEAARKRLGSYEDTLRWFLAFAEKDLKNMPASERAILNYDLFAAGLSATGNAADSWERLVDIKSAPLATLKRMQSYIQVSLPVLFGEAGLRTLKGVQWWGIERVSPPDAKEAKFEFLFYVGHVYEWCLSGFLTAVLRGGKRLRLCKRCNAPFVGNTKRMEYCGIDCSQRFRNEKKKGKRAAKKKR